MKKILFVFCLVLFITGLAAAQVRAGGTMYVSVKEITLKSGTGFFASNKGTIKYGDAVTVVRVDGRFVEVKNASNVTGWTATANLSARQVVAGTSSTATAREVALAGKGFNAEVESSYRENQNLNYADVDKVEAITVDETALRRFLEEGRLSMGDK